MSACRGEGPEPDLALAERFFGPPALGNISGDAVHPQRRRRIAPEPHLASRGDPADLARRMHNSYLVAYPPVPGRVERAGHRPGVKGDVVRMEPLAQHVR